MSIVNKYPEEKFMDRYTDAKVKKDFFKRIDYHRKYTLSSVWALFFSFSIVGWIWECSYHWFSRGEVVNRGAFHGPWVPIYGVALGLIVLLLQRLVDKPLLVFLMIVLISAVVEYSTSYFFEVYKGIRFWDYSKDFLNLHGRIYLEGIMFFGIGGCGVLYLLAPAVDELYKKIPKKILYVVLTILTILFLIDMVYSFANPNTSNGVVYV